jgi:hypothetical protein
VDGYTFQPGLLPDEGFIKLPKDSSNSDSTITVTQPDTAGVRCGNKKTKPLTKAVSNVTSIIKLAAAACNARRLCVAFTTSGNLYAAREEGNTWAQIPKCFTPTCSSSSDKPCKGTYVIAAGVVGQGVSPKGYAQQQKLATKDVELVDTQGVCSCRRDPVTGEEHAVCHYPASIQIASMLARHYASRAIMARLYWPLQKKSIGCGALC